MLQSLRQRCSVLCDTISSKVTFASEVMKVLDRFTAQRGNAIVGSSPFCRLSRLYIGWPDRVDTWRQEARPARRCIAAFVQALLKQTRQVSIIILTCSRAQQAVAQQQLNSFITDSGHERLEVTRIAMNDCWLQDIGPIFAHDIRGGVRAVNFEFNAWGGLQGGCYADWSKDRRFSAELQRRYGHNQLHVDVILEGGSISSDGRGTFLTTRECLLHPNRSGLDEQTLEDVLRASLGAQKVIWLERGAAYDYDTNGHVDNLAIFIAPHTVLLLWADANVCKEQHSRSTAALSILQDATDADGHRLVIHLVDAPPPQSRTAEEAITVERGAKARREGERLCASYVNLVIVENTVFAPSFGDAKADEKALMQLRKAFAESSKHVVQVPARELILAGGGLHCISLGEPAPLQ